MERTAMVERRGKRREGGGMGKENYSSMLISWMSSSEEPGSKSAPKQLER